VYCCSFVVVAVQSEETENWSVESVTAEFEVPMCHTPFRDNGNEASIRVPRMFHSHV
jgi:hypothetical protein